MEALDQLKDDFLSTISHKLRSPMTNIEMVTQMLKLLLQTDKNNGEGGTQVLDDPEWAQFKAKVDHYLLILEQECDGEKSGVGDRIIDFVEATAIPQALFSMLRALPNAVLSQCLHKEGGLLETEDEANIHQTTLINFSPTRRLEEIAHKYIRCFWEFYEPDRYLK